jgi:DNA-binding PadR family transcriptional regulator
MSPVFRHGRLRLYLLKLLDESPRHGYEVIRLLQDRFLGVYAPSPGTIYPRLARLEEDGLVTHEEVDGKKVYSITDKGREEIRNRLSDLTDLEDELTESLRDVAREISEDVRDTVRGIREELTAAARDFRSQHHDRGPGAARESAGAASGFGSATAPGSAGPGPAAGAPTSGGAAAGGTGTEEERTFAADEASRIREEARRAREEMRARFRARSRGHGDWAAWQERMGRPDLAGWAAWGDWARGQGGSGSGQSGSGGSAGQRAGTGGANPFSDLERLAIQFANELRTAARQAGNIGERSMSDLRDILTDTLAKVRVEVFTQDRGSAEPGSSGDGPAGTAKPGKDEQPGSPQPDDLH